MLREKRIKNLEERIKSRDAVILTLERENSDLKDKLKTANEKSELLYNQAGDIIEGYRDALVALKNSRTEYENLMKKVKKEHKHYKNKVDILLSKLKNQN